MRTKLLLFPLLILIMMSAIIWRIIPDWDAVQQAKIDLDERRLQVEDVKEKNSTISELITVYDNESASVGLIDGYVPLEAGDEDIMSNLISYANAQGGDNGLSFSSISMSSKVKNNKASAVNIPPEALSGKMTDFQGMIGEKMNIGEAPAEPVDLNVEISFEGKYDGMKEFFTKINALKRSNSVNSFSVTGDDEGKLIVDAMLGFNYLERYNPMIVDGAFLRNSLDKEIIEKVRKSATADVSKTNIGSVGRINPFLP